MELKRIVYVHQSQKGSHHESALRLDAQYLKHRKPGEKPIDFIRRRLRETIEGQKRGK